MRHYKVRAMLMTTLLALILSLFPGQLQSNGYDVVVNGLSVTGTIAEMKSGQLMLAVRPFVQALGGSLSWQQSAQRVTVHHGGSQLAVWIGSHTAFQDGRELWLPVAPYIKNGQTMVPGWWLATRLGADVRFGNGTLYVTTDGNGRHPFMKDSYYFPYPASARYEEYFDTMGDSRSWGGDRVHEGTDILASKGTPIVNVAAGTIVRLGWNELGGYRVTVRLDDFPKYQFYYAHLDRYAPGLYLGKHLFAGQFLGYVGSTGYGPEKTEGMFAPHLHFGIYGPDGAINSFGLLKFWERRKVQW